MLNKKFNQLDAIILKLITYWEINQVISICQMDVMDNNYKKGLKQEKKNVTIEFYTMKLVWIPNFNFNAKFWFFETNLP